MSILFPIGQISPLKDPELDRIFRQLRNYVTAINKNTKFRTTHDENTTPAEGQAWVWNGSKWTPDDVALPKELDDWLDAVTLLADGSANLASGVMQAGGYKSSDGTTGATANVEVAKVGGGTRTLHFKNGLYTGFTDS